jgi:putative ABC transport system permease protein
VTHQPGLPLVIALVVLVMLAIAASWVGRLKVERSIATAAVRAVVQLAAVALVITAVLSQLAWSLVFAAFMFGVAVFTSSRRIEAPRAWPWVAVAIGCGVLPVLAVIFLSGAVPWNGAALWCRWPASSSADRCRRSRWPVDGASLHSARSTEATRQRSPSVYPARWRSAR